MRDMVVLVEPLIPGLRRYARALLRDPTAADDLVQDCLEKAVSHWSRRRPDGNTKSWMFAILHNLAVNGLQRLKRQGPHMSVDEVDESTLGQAPAQEAALNQADILAAIERLPEGQRAVLLLVSVEDLSYAEAALALSVPIGTVMSRLARARERLRGELSEPACSAAPTGLRRVK